MFLSARPRLKFVSSFLLAMMLCVFSSSCRNPEQLAKDADEEVYRIIDGKWHDSFGSKANYRINDDRSDSNGLDSDGKGGSKKDMKVTDYLPDDGVLSLRDALYIATKFSRDYQGQKESLYSSALSLTSTRHQYAMQFMGSVDMDYTRSYNNATKTEDDVLLGGDVGVSQDFIFSNGIQIGTSLAVDWARFLTGDPQISLGSVLTSTIAAPIIGAGAGKSAYESLTQAERNVIYDIRSFNRYRKTFVSTIVSSYYSVLQQKERVNIAEASYKRLVDSTNQLNMEVAVGRRPQYDADEAKQRLLSAENGLISDRQSYEQALDSFKIRLAIPTEIEITLDQGELRALESLGITSPGYTEEDAIESALNNRLDLMNSRNGLDDSSRKLKLAAEGVGVQLDIIGGANAGSSSQNTDFTAIQLHRGTYSLALQADLALDQKRQRNAYRSALISMEQRLRNYDESVEQIKLSVRQAYRDLAETAESYRIQKLGLELAEKRYDREKLMLETSQGTVRLLLESEDAIVSAQNNVTNALIRHTIAKLNFFRDIGVLQVKPDGTWEQGV